MNIKEQYKLICNSEPNIPIFSQYWWLDAVAGVENWDVILVERGEEIVASFPYVKKRKLIFELITMPQLTQTLGIWIKYPQNQTYSNKLSFEKEVCSEIIGKLPKFDQFISNFHYNFTNWLPFYWNQFNQTTRYTYVIEDISNTEQVYNNFSRSKKKDIKKAKKIVKVLFDLSATDFYKNHKMTLDKQGEKISYSYELFKKVYDSAYKNNSGKTIYAIDEDGNIHSALFVVWNSYSAFDLISTIDPDFRSSGSATLLVWDIINYLSNKTLKFDFEGSMIEGVEQSFRHFGAIQTPYYQITKNNSKFLKLRSIFKDILR